MSPSQQGRDIDTYIHGGIAGGRRICYGQAKRNQPNLSTACGLARMTIWNPEELQPQSKAAPNCHFFPMGLHWVHGCSMLEAGAMRRALRMVLWWGKSAQWGLRQGRRVNRNHSQELGAFTNGKTGLSQAGGMAGELRNIPPWLSRFSRRTRQQYFSRWSQQQGRNGDLLKVHTAEGAIGEQRLPTPQLTARM